MPSHDAKNRSMAPPRAAGSLPVAGPETQDVIHSEVFVSDLKAPLSEEESIERIEAVLKLAGMPSLAELNRMDAEAEARAKQKAAKRRR